MNRILLPLAIATTIAMAAPASAITFGVTFPTLTYPPKPAPETTQACTDLTTLDDVICVN